MNNSIQNSVVCILLSFCLFSCQNTADTTKKVSPENKLQSDKSSEPDLTEFKKVETESQIKPKSEPISESKKTDLEAKAKANPNNKSEQTKPKPKAEVKPKKKPVVLRKPKIQFEKTIHDFGEIKEGDIIKHKFNFKNTGNAELVIKSAHASCGCTDPSYPFIGTAPGEEGYIGVTYHSVSKAGPQKPEVTIKTNVNNNSIVLYLTGTVVPKEKEETLEKKDSTELKKGN